MLDTLGGDRVAETIRNLPRMFGGSEVIEKAMTLCKSDKAQSSLNYLDKLYKKLGGATGGDNLIIDLSLVHRSNYYTGIVSADTPRAAEPPFFRAAGTTALSRNSARICRLSASAFRPTTSRERRLCAAK